MENKPLVEVDQVTAPECSAKDRVLQPAPQNVIDHLVSVFHFETVLEHALIHNAVSQDVSDRVSYSILSRRWIEDFLRIH